MYVEKKQMWKLKEKKQEIIIQMNYDTVNKLNEIRDATLIVVLCDNPSGIVLVVLFYCLERDFKKTPLYNIFKYQNMCSISNQIR